MLKLFISIIISTTLLSSLIAGQDAYRADIAKWRAKREADLKADNGWLTVVGLFWLKEGVNTVGVGPGSDVELTDSFKGGKFGEIVLSKDGKAELTVADGVRAQINGKDVKTAELSSNGEPPIVTFGSQSFFLIKRGDRYAIRLRDTESKYRRSFTHLKWFPVDPRARVVATLEKYAEQKNVLIPNVLGGTFNMKAPGLLRFTLDGRELTLEPVDEDGHLFIIFRDQSSRTETYGSGRFLYADVGPDGKVVLDFNFAENPPCAYSAFATCPLPPRQNRLPVGIRAGEKRYIK